MAMINKSNTQGMPLKNEDSDLKRILTLVISNYRIFLIWLGISLGVAMAANLFTTPKYKIAASILIKDGEKKATSMGNAAEYLNSRLFHEENNFQNEIWILKSKPVIEQTIQDLQLTVSYFRKEGYRYIDDYGKAPFQVLLPENHIQPVGVMFKLKFSDPQHFTIKADGKNVSFRNLQTGSEESSRKKWDLQNEGESGQLIDSTEYAFVILTDPSVDTTVLTGHDYAFMMRDAKSLSDAISEQINYNVVDKLATVIQIVYKSASPEKGIDIVNEIMEAYSDQNLKSKNHHAEITIAYIERQLNEISDSLKYAEDKLQRFKSYNQLLNISNQTNTILEQYSELENQLAELESRQRYYQYVMDYLSGNDDFSNMIVPASMGISDPLLNNLMTDLINAQTQRTTLIQNNQERNPMVQILNNQISNTKKTISENIAAIMATTQLTLNEKTNRLAELKQTIGRLPATQRQLSGIERSYKLNDAIYNYLLEKRAEAKITLASNIPDNVIIEPARKVGNKPVSPNKQINLMAALLLGFAVPLGFLMTRNLLNNLIDSEDSFELLSDMPVLGRILHVSDMNPGASVYGPPRSIVAESFSSLRTNIELHFKRIEPKVILVTSAMAGEGKSFTALNLAIGYARLGKRTLLMNCDLRNPASYFMNGNDHDVGLSDYFKDHVDVPAMIRASGYTNLDYIHSGAVPENPDQLLAMKKAALLFEKLKTMYDCIILDTAPLSIVTDTYLLMDYSNIRLVVVRLGYSQNGWVGKMLDEMADKKLGRVAVVLNDVRFRDTAYARHYGYGQAVGPNALLDMAKRTFHMKTS